MLEILISQDIIIDRPLRSDCNNYCIVKENNDILAYASLDIGYKIDIINMWFKEKNDNILDGILKTIANYAYNKGINEIISNDPLVINYVNNKNINLDGSTFHVSEFILKSNTCKDNK